VITTVIWQSTSAYPPEYTAAMGFACSWSWQWRSAWRLCCNGSYATITGKAFRPRPLRWGQGLPI
jgi:hypothetical protein